MLTSGIIKTAQTGTLCFCIHPCSVLDNTMASKSRRLNFSLMERDVLLRLIEDNIEIVEAKRNDGMTVRQKDAAWSRIVAGFNAEHNVVKRTHRQLRKYWNNLKMRAKKSACANGYSTLKLPTPGSVAMRLARPTSRSYGVPNMAPDGLVFNAGQACTGVNGIPSASLGSLVVKSEPQNPYEGPLVGGQEEEDEQEEAVCLGRSNDDVMDKEEAEFEDVLDSDAEEELGEVFQCESDNDYRHETATGVTSDYDIATTSSQHPQWTAMDYARNEHEAKMALLTVQMETAHEQRELAREVREQTRQRHRMEIQVLEEKRRYRRMKMNSMSSPHGHSLVLGTHEPRPLELKQKSDFGKSVHVVS